MKAIVCGTGVAGLTLALRLGRAGWEVLLLDRQRRVPRADYLIDVSGAGYSSAERLGLMPQLNLISYDVPEMVWLDQCGAPAARLHRSSLERAAGGRLMTLMRSDLERVLLASLSRSTQIRCDNAIEDIELRRDDVRVRLTDGSFESADLVIGADGLHSRVREVLLGDTELAFRYLGMHTASFAIHDPEIHAKLAGRLVLMATPGRQVSFFPLRSAGMVAASFAHVARETARIPICAASALSEEFKSFGWIVPAALQKARRLTDIYYDDIGQIELSRWSFGRVALLGDACQAASVVLGRGASSALHSACVLADELESDNRITAALVRYEERLKPSVRKTQERRRRAAPWFVPKSWLRLNVRNTAVRVMDHRSLSWLLRPMLT